MINKVAIVDDDTIFQFTTRINIEKGKLAKEVMFFGDGEEILQFLQNAENEDLPDLILLDINMPIIDGWDFLIAFNDLQNTINKNIKIYMISSSINPVDVRRAKESPYITDYITKPIRKEDLRKIFKP